MNATISRRLWILAAAFAIATGSAGAHPQSSDARMPQNCIGCDFSHRNLAGANLANAEYTGSDFSYAVLRGASLRNARLEGVDFRGADLRGVDFTGAHLEGVDLRVLALFYRFAPATSLLRVVEPKKRNLTFSPPTAPRTSTPRTTSTPWARRYFTRWPPINPPAPQTATFLPFSFMRIQKAP